MNNMERDENKEDVRDYYCFLSHSDHGGDYDSIKFHFHEKLTETEFRDYVKTATESALNYAIEHPDEFHWDWISHNGIKYRSLYPQIAKELEKIGFKREEPEEREFIEFGFKTSGSVCNPEDPSISDIECYKTFIESLDENLRKRAIEISKERKR